MTVAKNGTGTHRHLTLVDAAAGIRDGAFTCVDLVQESLNAIDAGNRSINAVISTEAEAALEAAAALDRKLKAGEVVGPLHGVPLAHKDMYYRAGKVSTCGSRIRKDFKPSRTATVINRMESVGAITVGTLNMAEFAQNGTGHNDHFGHCRNPWNPDYCPGGSSSGSGAAVASRFIYGALGSDTGGSIRVPASMCGVTGIKPTQTRVSRYGVMPLSFSTDNVGPLCRTARDCARILGAIAGHDPADPTSSKEPVPDYEAGLDGDIRELQIGIPTNYFFDGIDPEVARAFDEAMKVLEGRGATLVRIETPHMEAVDTYSAVVSRAEAVAIHAKWMAECPQDYSPYLSARIYAGYAIPAGLYVEALSRRGPILRDIARQVFSKVNVFAAPTLRHKTPTLKSTDPATGTPEALFATATLSTNTRPANYIGLPSVSAPCGFDSNGLPIGVLIQGRPFAEGRILKVIDAYQRDTDWHARRPGI
jgi:aspartyl-tRNA(Asn)/glutamyl-tRNA(Gln) amidotransferase subunit A